MDLTIVIVSFKSGDILHRCIKSIDKKYTIIIVENSQNVKLKEELEKKYSNVKCILPEKNLGYGAGNNLGIKSSKTKYGTADASINATKIHKKTKPHNF